MSNSPTGPTTTMGDPVVPILDIPPDENLGLSDEAVAAVTAVAPDEQQRPPVTDSAVVADTGGAKEDLEQASMELDAAVATITTTTTTTTVTVTDTPDSSVEPSGVDGGEGEGAGAGSKSLTVDTQTVVEESRLPVVVEKVLDDDAVAPVGQEQINSLDVDGRGNAQAEIVVGTEVLEPVDILVSKETTTTITLDTEPPAVPDADADLLGGSAAEGAEDEPSILETMPILGKTKRDEEEVAGVVADGSAGLDDAICPPLKKVKSDADIDVVKEVDVAMTDVVLAGEPAEVLKREESEDGPSEELKEGLEDLKEELEDLKEELKEDLKEELKEDLKEELKEMQEHLQGGSNQEVQGSEDAAQPEPVQLGPRTFKSGVEMFQYFYNLLHYWVTNVDVNKYEHMVLLDLIRKGHRDAEEKIGPGIKSFQIRFHPGWHSRCYYLFRTDGTVDDFSYRKCVDKIMPLPESLYSSSGDLILEKVLGEDDKWGKKSKGKGFTREAGDGQGGKNRGRGGRWGRGRGGGRRGR